MRNQVSNAMLEGIVELNLPLKRTEVSKHLIENKGFNVGQIRNGIPRMIKNKLLKSLPGGKIALGKNANVTGRSPGKSLSSDLPSVGSDETKDLDDALLSIGNLAGAGRKYKAALFKIHQIIGEALQE